MGISSCIFEQKKNKVKLMRIIIVSMVILFILPLSQPIYAEINLSESFGMNIGHVNIEQLNEVLKVIKNVGVNWIRIDFTWSALESSKGQYSFSYYDQLVNTISKSGIKILALISGPPKWAEPLDKNIDAWKDFLKKLVSRYGDRIKYWEILNEPDSEYIYPLPPRIYVTLLKEARDIIKQIDPNANIVSAGLTSAGLDYLEDMYKNGFKGLADIVAIHPYAQNPYSVLRITKAFRMIMREYGEGNKPLWVTEIGWPVRGESVGGFLKGVGEENQALYLQQSLGGLIEGLKVDKVFWFKIIDGPTGLNETPYWGLITEDLKLRKSFIMLNEILSWYSLQPFKPKIAISPSELKTIQDVTITVDLPRETNLAWHVEYEVAPNLWREIGLVNSSKKALTWKPPTYGQYKLRASWFEGCYSSYSPESFLKVGEEPIQPHLFLPSGISSTWLNFSVILIIIFIAFGIALTISKLLEKRPKVLKWIRLSLKILAIIAFLYPLLSGFQSVNWSITQLITPKFQIPQVGFVSQYFYTDVIGPKTTTVGLEIINKGDFSIKIIDAKGSILIGGKSVGSVALQQPVQLEVGRLTAALLTIKLDSRELVLKTVRSDPSQLVQVNLNLIVEVMGARSEFSYQTQVPAEVLLG